MSILGDPFGETNMKNPKILPFQLGNYLPDPFYFWGSKLLNGNGSTSRPRLGLFWYSSSKYWGCPILPRTQMIKCLISRRYMYLSPNTSRLPSPPIPCGHDTTLTAPPCPASLGPRCQAVDAVPAWKNGKLLGGFFCIPSAEEVLGDFPWDDL